MTIPTTYGRSPFVPNLTPTQFFSTFINTLLCISAYPSALYNVTMAENLITIVIVISFSLKALSFVFLALTPPLKTERLNGPFDLSMTFYVLFFSKPRFLLVFGLKHYALPPISSTFGLPRHVPYTHLSNPFFYLPRTTVHFVSSAAFVFPTSPQLPITN